MTARSDALAAVGRRAATTQAYAGMGPLDTSSISTWPITEKAAVKAHPRRYRTGIPADIRIASSGTTGHPMPSYRTWQEADDNAAAVAAAWMALLPENAAVASLLDHNASAAGMLVELVARHNNWPLARLFPYGIGGTRFEQVASAFVEFSPGVVITTPSGAIDIEEAWRRSGCFEEAARSVRALLLIGAPATAGMRLRLERSWRANAYIAAYGSTELGTIACGCEDGRLHVLADRHHLETRADGVVGPLEGGTTGELIATPLLSEATVLVRYATGDVVSAVPCACSVGGMAIVISGRDDDFILAGDRVIGPEEVEHAVFVQGRGGDYLLEVNEDCRLVGVQVLPMSDLDVDLGAISDALGADAHLVDRLPSLTRAGGVIKSWRRTRVVTIYREDG